MWDRGCNALKKMAEANTDSWYVQLQQAQAVYLLTRSQMLTTSYVERLAEHLTAQSDSSWKESAAPVYLAASYALLHEDEQARQWLKQYQPPEKQRQRQTDFYTDLQTDSLYVYLIAKHFPKKLQELTARDFNRLTDPIQRQSYCTHSAALTILAMDACVRGSSSGSVKINLEQKIGQNPWQSLPVPNEVSSLSTFAPGATALRIRQSSDTRIFYQAITTAFDRTRPTEAKANGVEVEREILDANENPVTRVKLGDLVTVRIRVRCLERDTLANLVLTDLLPGGVEVETASVRNHEQASNAWFYTDYTDVREDRVVVYGTAYNRIREFSYQMRATNRGHYVLPAIRAESMYDQSLCGHGATGVLEIE
jgi:uncharacterized repeat protein (TIGR01451 family)